MYLIIWDDSSVSALNQEIIPPELLELNELGEVCIVRHWGDQGFQRLDDCGTTWSSFPDYSLSELANRNFDDSNEDEDSYLDDEPGSVDLDPE